MCVQYLQEYIAYTIQFFMQKKYPYLPWKIREYESLSTKMKANYVLFVLLIAYSQKWILWTSDSVIILLTGMKSKVDNYADDCNYEDKCKTADYQLQPCKK